MNKKMAVAVETAELFRNYRMTDLHSPQTKARRYREFLAFCSKHNITEEQHKAIILLDASF